MKKKFVFVLLCVYCSIFSWSQGHERFEGTITDPESHTIPGAFIKILNTDYTAVANDKGQFSFRDLVTGRYVIQINAYGFSSTTEVVDLAGRSQPFHFVIQPSVKQLDEVVVNAQKKDELIQHLPLSLTALTARQVQDYRLWSTSDLSAVIPNLYGSDPGDRRTVTSIRGIASSSYDQAVATYVDGVNQFTLDTYINPLFDIERIEVLRGPQSTLYGRNAMGGVINIITKQPNNKTEGFAEASVGNYGLQRYTAGVTTPIIKNKLFFGVAGLYEGFHGFYTNTFNNSRYDQQHSFAGNYYLKYLPSAGWSVTLNAKHNNNRNNGAFPLVFGADEAFKHPYQLNQNATTTLVDNIFNGSLSINHTGAGFNFSSQTAYQTNYRIYSNPIDADFSPIDGITIINNYGHNWNYVHVLTEELKFTSPATASRFKWTAGAYGFLYDNPNKQATHFGADATYVGSPDVNYSLISTTKTKGSGIAFYGQASYAIGKLDLIAGVRYDDEHRKEDVFGLYEKDGNPGGAFPFRTDTAASINFGAFSPKLGLDYRLSAGSFLYATYSKGYRAGGLTPLSSDPSQPALFPYKPEYSNNFEVGIKNSLLQNRLLINVTGFYTTVTDAQVPTLVLPDAITITKNTGRLESKGVEAELKAQVLNGLKVEYGFGYTDARYQSLKLSQNGSEVNLKGNRQLFTPDVTSMLAMQYERKLDHKGTVSLLVRGEWKYLGNQYFDLANTIKQGAYHILNAKAGVQVGKASLYLWGRNLSDTRYISYGYDFGAVHLGNPRTYGVSAGYRF